MTNTHLLGNLIVLCRAVRYLEKYLPKSYMLRLSLFSKWCPVYSKLQQRSYSFHCVTSTAWWTNFLRCRDHNTSSQPLYLYGMNGTKKKEKFTVATLTHKFKVGFHQLAVKTIKNHMSRWSATAMQVHSLSIVFSEFTIRFQKYISTLISKTLIPWYIFKTGMNTKVSGWVDEQCSVFKWYCDMKWVDYYLPIFLLFRFVDPLETLQGYCKNRSTNGVTYVSQFATIASSKSLILRTLKRNEF